MNDISEGVLNESRATSWATCGWLLEIASIVLPIHYPTVAVDWTRQLDERLPRWLGIVPSQTRPETMRMRMYSVRSSTE